MGQLIMRYDNISAKDQTLEFELPQDGNGIYFINIQLKDGSSISRKINNIK
jgi:hypothetical protein